MLQTLKAAPAKKDMAVLALHTAVLVVRMAAAQVFSRRSAGKMRLIWQQNRRNADKDIKMLGAPKLCASA